MLKKDNKLLLLILILYIVMLILYILEFKIIPYQDKWIFDGMYGTILIIILLLLLLFLKPLQNSLVFTVILSIFLLLNFTPQLKYLYGYGIFDNIAHAGAVQQLVANNYIPSEGFYYGQFWDYRTIPNSHILAGIMKIVTGINTYTVSKFFLPTICIILPLLGISFIQKISKNNTIRYYASLVFLVTFVGIYVFTGSNYGFIMFVLSLYITITLFVEPQKISKNNYILIPIIYIALIFSHTISTILVFLSVFSYMLISLVNIRDKNLKDKKLSKYLLEKQSFFTKIIILTIFIMLVVIHLNYYATYYMNMYAEFIKNIINNEINTPLTTQIVSIKKYTIEEILRVIIVRNSSDIIFYSLFIASLVYSFRTKNNETKKIIITSINLIILPIIFIIFLSFKVALYYQTSYDNHIRFLLAPSIIIILYYLYKKSVRKKLYLIIRYILFILLIVTFLVQSYPYQQILQNDSKTLVMYHNVNSIYQYYVIDFISNYIEHDITIYGDETSLWQIVGFSPNLSSQLQWISVFDLFKQQLLDVNYDNAVAVIHLFGKAGPLSEFSNFEPSNVNSYLLKNIFSFSLFYNSEESFGIVLKT